MLYFRSLIYHQSNFGQKKMIKNNNRSTSKKMHLYQITIKTHNASSS